MVRSIQTGFSYLYQLERSGVKYNLNNIRALMRAIGNPHEKLRFVHVAGTNGKGAVASFIAAIMQEYGFKTGLFTSPHILSFNERIRINGETIPDRYIWDFMESNRKLIRKIKPSFFELNTALAFKYFFDKRVSVAVIEAGLGGRLDSTNIILPVVSVITEIGMDHTDYLGKTLKSIAREKAGILKPGVPAVISDSHTSLRSIFRNRQTNADLFFLDDVVRYHITNTTLKDSTFRLIGHTGKFRIPLPGSFQVRNAVTAVLATKIFFRGIGYEPASDDGFRKGLSNVRKCSGYRCRLEFLRQTGKYWILDVSHNPDAIKFTIETSKKLLDGFGKRIVVFGMMKDKDYRTSVRILANFADYLIITRPDYTRALEPEMVSKFIQRCPLGKKIHTYVANNVSSAIRKAKGMATGRDVIIVIGSFFLVSDVIKVARLRIKPGQV